MIEIIGFLLGWIILGFVASVLICDLYQKIKFKRNKNG